MEKAKRIALIIRTLRDLFKTKDSLVGVDDWDALIGCLQELERLGNELLDEEQNQTAEE